MFLDRHKFKIKTIITQKKVLKFEFETRRYCPIIEFNVILLLDNIVVYIQICNL